MKPPKENPCKLKDGEEVFWLRHGMEWDDSGANLSVHDGANNRDGPFLIISQVKTTSSLSGVDTLRALAHRILCAIGDEEPSS